MMMERNEQPVHADSMQFHARSIGVSLTVHDLATSIDWYHGAVGFAIDRRIEREGTLRSVALKAGDVRILLNQDDGAKGWDRKKGQGFSISLTTDQNIDEIANRIKAHGVVLDLEPTDMPWGMRSIRLTDPDGYKLAISQPITPA